MNKNKTNEVPAVKVNYVITRGRLWDQLQYSLFKLLDWHVGKAVCVTLFDDGAVMINDCPSSLKAELKEKIGGHTSDVPGFTKEWVSDDTDVYIVLRVVTDWINRQ